MNRQQAIAHLRKVGILPPCAHSPIAIAVRAAYPR